MRRAIVPFLGLAAALMQTPALAADAKPQWLIVLTLARPELHDPKTWTEKDSAAVTAHFNRLQRLVSDGTVIIAGRTQDSDERGHLVRDGMGLVIVEASDRATAEQLMRDDPAIQAGVMQGKLFSYRIAVQRK